MLYVRGNKELFFSESHTKHIHKLCGQNVEILITERGGTCSNHWSLKD